MNRHCEERSDEAIQLDPTAAPEMTGATVPRTFAAVCGARGDLYLFAPFLAPVGPLSGVFLGDR